MSPDKSTAEGCVRYIVVIKRSKDESVTWMDVDDSTDHYIINLIFDQ